MTDGRSISPNTQEEQDDIQQTASPSSSFTSYFSRLRNSIFKPSSPSPKANVIGSYSPKAIAELIDGSPLLNNFTSDKKKRLSIQGGVPRRITNPRSPSLTHIPTGTYSNLYTNLRTYEQELNNDLERRISTVYDGTTVSRDSSPLNSLPLPQNNLLQMTSSTPENVEYASNVYTDDQGNLARPPFIKLDPRERHHLLQLKRSLDTQESIQKRIKYMVDPNETISFINKTNKVDMATQTHDVDYLSKKLHFKRKQSSTTTSPPLKKRRGFFSGEFKYDIPKHESKTISTIPSVNSELNGYLGNITKPKFNKLESKPSPLTQVIPQQDEDPTLKKFSTSSPLRDREIMFSKTITPGELKLDEEYLKKSESISNIIKLKDSVEASKKVATIPSSGFKFDIKKDDINDILKQRKDNDDLFANSKLLNQQRKVAIETSHAKPQPIMSIAGIIENNDDSEVVRKKSRKRSSGDDEENPTPLFSIDKKKEEEQPKFSFGEKKEKPSVAVAAPSFSFGEKKDEAPKSLFDNKDTTPKISFEKKDETLKLDKNNETPKLFGIDKPNGTAKPLFSFGKKEETSTASNAEVAAGTTPKPAFSFGGKTEETTEKKEDTVAKPTCVFGKKDEQDKATSGLFGKKDEDSTSKPASIFTFGKKDEDSTAKPTSLTFGKTDEKEKATTPFNLGQKPTESSNLFANKESQGKSLFGESKTKSNIFSIDKTKETKPSIFDKSSTPTFSFGSNKQSSETKESEKPSPFSQPSSKESSAFTFGKPSGATTETSSSESAGEFKTNNATSNVTPFKFETSTTTPSTDKVSTSSTTTPVFSFNLDKKASSETSSKQPIFGQSQETAKPNVSFGGSTTTEAIKPTFSFGSINNTPSPTIVPSNPNFKFAAGVSAPITSKPSFNFASKAGSPATAPNFMVNSQPQPQPQPQQQPFSQPTFGTPSSTNPFGQPQQQQSTNQPAFGGQQPSPFNFGGGMQQAGSPGPGQFTFGTGSKEPTPDPASIFKTHASAFGQSPQSMPGQGSPFGTSGVPTLPGNRPRLIPRSRKR